MRSLSMPLTLAFITIVTGVHYSIAAGGSIYQTVESFVLVRIMHSVTVKNENSTRSEGLIEFKQGLSYVQQQQYEKAIEAFNKAEAKGHHSFQMLLIRAAAYQELKQYKEAYSDASRAIDMHPTNGLGYQVRAAIHQSTNNLDESIQDLTAGIKVSSGDLAARLYQTRGTILLRLGQQEEALADISKALELGNELPVVYYQKGRALLGLGKYKEAIESFSEALTRERNHYRSRRSRGWVYGCIGEFKNAIDDFNILLRHNPKDAVVHGLRGWVRLEDGDVDGALSDLQYAAEHGLSGSTTYLNIANALYAQGRLHEALKANTKALNFKDPDDEAAVYFQRGLLYLVAGKWKQAKALYQRALDRAVSVTDRIVIKNAIGDLEQAMNVYRKTKAPGQEIVAKLKVATEQISEAAKIPTECQQARYGEE